MASTKIEWANRVWNPVTGCTKVSAGCANCYAERFAKRLQANPKVKGKYSEGFRVQCHDNELTTPLKWKKQQRIFLCSMGDLFHEDVPFEFIDAVFSVMSDIDQHTYMVLTKRPERMLDFYIWKRNKLGFGYGSRWQAKDNVWVGVSAENQDQMLGRVGTLKMVPAAIRFISCEPLLHEILYVPGLDPNDRKIHWIIAGGETGPKARRLNPDWIRNIRNICQETHTPFFFKGYGTVARINLGRELDGKEYSEFPNANQ